MERVKAASKHERRHPLKYKAQEPTTESAALLKSETVRGRINLGGRKPAYTCEKQMDEQIEEEYKVNRPVETQELQFTHEETRKSKDCLEQKDNDESISDKNFIEICLNNVNVMDEIRDQILEGKEKKLKTKFISKISSIIKNILKQVSAQAPRAADQ
ncbi:hypothetical protein BaRGS_00017609 [Batillaria attramentaria]|uniref:Uncharacterized protein n=1 Tax=Batillaria attramentaria TaxID=370345 RepID=A0ABD0KWP8_9CAEN